MNRSKRAIKTPKRFDDEPFEAPRKHHNHLSKQLPTVETPAKPTPEPTPSKSIIKVKLAKTKPRDVALPTPPSISLPRPRRIDDDRPTETPTKKQQPPPPQRQPSPQQVPVIEQSTPVSIKSELAPATTKEPTVRIKQPKLKPLLSCEAPPPPPPPPPAIPIVRRPKKRRPRTPPAYADLIPNNVLPFWDARTAAEDHEDDNVKELVHCQCGIGEELGLMVQCETCLTWQHAHCLGIERPEDAPDGYTCQACANPKFARDSMRWAYDQDWLLKGRMKQFPCDPNSLPQKNIQILRQINQLIGDVLKIHQYIHSLRVKSKILMSAEDDDSELKMFKVPWPANFQRRDGSMFEPSMNKTLNDVVSTLSATVETPDPDDIHVDHVVEPSLPDIGQLGDVSAILDNTDMPNVSLQPMTTNTEATPNDCRVNLKLHIQQAEEFIGLELSQVEEQLAAIEKECTPPNNGDLTTSFESLKNDLLSVRRYIYSEKKY